MALLSLLLGAKEISIPPRETAAPWKKDYPLYKRSFGVRCPNPRCVTVQKTETKYIKPEFKIINERPLTLRCTYCEHEVYPSYIASADWHEGRTDSKRYHSASSHW
ncbi:hypothetical protein ACFLWY_05435, partial [Chloroflexota bacterium]